MSHDKKKVEEYRKLFTADDWSVDTLRAADEVTKKIAEEELGITTYTNQIEVVNSEQLLDAMSLIGLPISYPHWSFGKSFVGSANRYLKGKMGLSYEMVINSNPCVSYNLETNTTTMMVLVIAHACQGHNSFFKNNYLFKEWTNADAIVDYMTFAKNYILKCEELYGPEEVEEVLDACHSLMDLGVDKYKKPPRKTMQSEALRLQKRLEAEEEDYDELWDTLPIKEKKKKKRNTNSFEPQENILYYIEKNAPKLEKWKKELIRIVRKVAQYFYPQGQTKMINEGWATFTHYYIVNRMHELGYVDDGFMLEFMDNHTKVIYQPSYKQAGPYFNPYTLGFNIFMDIKRICENPTEEDKEWFPNLIGKDWVKEVNWAYKNFRDESFIRQYLSPKVIRDMQMFSIVDSEESRYYKVDAIHNERGYKKIRKALADSYLRDNRVPNIQITRIAEYSNREMVLTHYVKDGVMLDENSAKQTLDYVHYLWGFPVYLYDVYEDGERDLGWKVE